MKWIVTCISILTLFSCVKTKEEVAGNFDSTYYTENHRPQFHFSPAKNWTNDPNGLVFYEGEYHIFYQYNPYGTTWGHMSWGHAVSKDLLHWEHLPVAIEEYQDATTGDSTMIFSGTVVVDKNNSSGLCEGKDCMVSIYTSHVYKGSQGLVQHQSLAYSNDKGRTWKRYTKNPVLDIQRKDFRDPKIFWYEPQQNWVMALVIPDLFKVRFYKSKNLLEWAQLSEFGGLGDTARIWECPDIYELPVDDQPGKTKWVLSLSGSHPQGPAFVGMQYFVGEFDGTKFTPDDLKQPPLYVDYGKDFYAGIVFNNATREDKRAVMIGWANNWTYGGQIPTSPWRSAMSIPRLLSLKKTEAGFRLIQQPLETITTLREKEITDLSNIAGKALELEVVMEPAGAFETGLSILKSGDEKTSIVYLGEDGVLILGREHSGDVDFNKDFPSMERVKVRLINGKLKLRIFIDHSIIEVFVNDGEQTLCEQVFPMLTEARVETYPEPGAKNISIKAWELKSTWR